jgi:CRISPR-associated protein Csb1
MAYALQTTVLSLPAIRRLRFPGGSEAVHSARDEAAHVALAALGLAAIAFQRRLGYDLRSRCAMVPEDGSAFEVVTTCKEIESFPLTSDDAAAILSHAVEVATRAGLPWRDKPVVLTPKPALVDLIKKSREAGAAEEA